MEYKKLIYNPVSFVIIITIMIVGIFLGSFTFVFSLYLLGEGISFMDIFNRYLWFHKLSLVIFFISIPFAVRNYLKEIIYHLNTKVYKHRVT